MEVKERQLATAIWETEAGDRELRCYGTAEAAFRGAALMLIEKLEFWPGAAPGEALVELFLAERYGEMVETWERFARPHPAAPQMSLEWATLDRDPLELEVARRRALSWLTGAEPSAEGESASR